jgi:hypothetical protein
MRQKKLARLGVRMQFLSQDLHFLALRASTQSYQNFIIFIISDNQSLKRSINAHQVIQQSTMSSPSQLCRAPRMGGVKGSPRMASALRLACQHPTLTQVQGLRLADSSKGEANPRNKQKLLSKRRRGVEPDDNNENNRLGVEVFRARRRLDQVARMPLAFIEFQIVSSASGISDTDNTAGENEKANALANSAATNSRGM